MGKTALVHGLGLSFLERGHFFGYVDAEYTTPEDWLRKLMGTYADHPGFVAKRPKTYEETVDAVRQFVEVVAEAREKGELDPETSALVAIDSVRKLVPDRLLEKIHKEGAQGKKGSIDGAGGRAAQMRAALNAQWLDELVPLLYHTRTALVFVAREYEADKADNPFAPDVKVGGGRALEYESSVIVRVTRAGWVKVEDGPVYGERHLVRIRKSKVGPKEAKVVDAVFHTSNGVLVPEGFDRARDLVYFGENSGAVLKRGNTYWFGKRKLGVGVTNAVKKLARDEGLAQAVEAACRRVVGMEGS
jgi:RecA/RadA recombinase